MFACIGTVSFTLTAVSALYSALPASKQVANGSIYILPRTADHGATCGTLCVILAILLPGAPFGETYIEQTVARTIFQRFSIRKTFATLCTVFLLAVPRRLLQVYEATGFSILFVLYSACTSTYMIQIIRWIPNWQSAGTKFSSSTASICISLFPLCFTRGTPAVVRGILLLSHILLFRISPSSKSCTNWFLLPARF